MKTTHEFHYEDNRTVLYHGNCMYWFNHLPPEHVDFILTDPPYECSTTTITRQGQKKLDSNFGDWDRFFTDWIHEAYRVLKENSGMVVFVPATRFEQLLNTCESVGFKYIQPWFWHKTNPPVAMRGSLQWAVEHMMYVRKGSHKLQIKNKGRCHNLFNYPVPHRGRIHKTQKPVELMIELVELVSSEGDLILDPFSGSGSTGIAATQRDRRYIGFEKDEKHYEDSVCRFNSLQDIYE